MASACLPWPLLKHDRVMGVFAMETDSTSCKKPALPACHVFPTFESQPTRTGSGVSGRTGQDGGMVPRFHPTPTPSPHPTLSTLPTPCPSPSTSLPLPACISLPLPHTLGQHPLWLGHFPHPTGMGRQTDKTGTGETVYTPGCCCTLGSGVPSLWSLTYLLSASWT